MLICTCMIAVSLLVLTCCNAKIQVWKVMALKHFNINMQKTCKYLTLFLFTGKNDGSVKGVRYFKCKNRHGIFVRHDKLIMDKKRKGAKMKNLPSPLRRSTGNLTSPGATSAVRDSVSSPSSRPSFMKATSSSSAKHK